MVDKQYRTIEFISDSLTLIIDDITKFIRTLVRDTERIYHILNPDPNNNEVLDIISNATGLDNNLIKKEMKKKQFENSILDLGEPRLFPSKLFIRDLQNAGADITWTNISPDNMKKVLAKGELLYYDKLNLPK
jgi:hypothetical protein